MFGSSSGGPYSHHATALSPSKTKEACARPSLTNRSLSARLPSAVKVLSAWKVWKYVHQHPPKTPLCRSMSRANASQVSASSALTVYSLMVRTLELVADVQRPECTTPRPRWRSRSVHPEAERVSRRAGVDGEHLLAVGV